MADQTGYAAPDITASPLFGRERELATLCAALDAALAGRGSLVLIGGEAGIGKTALAEGLCVQAAERGALVLAGRCYDLSETPPYGPWAEALARAPQADALPPVPDFGGGGVTSQAALFAAVRGYLSVLAASRPLVLLLDDLHWADPASLNLLRVLARGLANIPLLMLATYRTDDVGDGHPLATLLPLLVGESRAPRLDLRPLDEVAIGALVAARYPLNGADRARLVGYLVGRTEGNALFLGELLRTLEGEGLLRQDGAGWVVGDLTATPVPALLRQVIAGRVARLTPETARLLTIAAIIGQVVPLAVWAAVGGAVEENLLDHAERALGARLLTETSHGDGVRFAHALIREALYAGTPALRRRAVHRRAAEVLSAMPDPDPDVVAHHLRQAGDARAVDWLVQAAERAGRAFAYLTAADRLAAALTLLGDTPATAGARGWLHLRLAIARRFEDPPGSLARAEEVVGLALAVGDRPLATMTRYFQAHLRCWRDLGRGLDELAAVVTEMDALPAVERASLETAAPPGMLPLDATGPWSVLLDWSSRAGRFAEVATLGARIEATLAAAGAPAAHGRALIGRNHGFALFHAMLGRPAEARSLLERHRAKSLASGDFTNFTTETGELLAWVVLPYGAEDLAERRQLANEVAAAAMSASGVLTVERSPGRAYLVAPWFVEGRWAEIRHLADETRAWETITATTLWRDAYPAVLGELARAQGEPAQAWNLVREAFPMGVEHPPGNTYFRTGLALQRLAAALALDAGDLPTAQRWLLAHDRWLAWGGAVLGRAEGQLAWAAYHRAAGDPVLALAHAERARQHATEPRQPLALLATQRLLGELGMITGRLAEAEGHLAAAQVLADACAAPYEHALTLLAMVELHLAADQRGQAKVALASAHALLAPLGAALALARATALDARLLAMPPPLPTESPFGLTARETEVLRLLAEGLSDLQIGARLSISRNTIATHTRAIYGKLGVNSRTAAARIALDHDLR